MNDDCHVVTKNIRSRIFFFEKFNQLTFERSITQRSATKLNTHKPVITKIK
jgi:hypothetical protein